MNKWWLNLINIVMQSISGPMREQIVASVNEWELKAKETESPFDDVLVGVVKWLLVIE